MDINPKQAYNTQDSSSPSISSSKSKSDSESEPESEAKIVTIAISLDKRALYNEKATLVSYRLAKSDWISDTSTTSYIID